MLQPLARAAALAWGAGIASMTVTKLVLNLGPGALAFDLAACLWACAGATYVLSSAGLLARARQPRLKPTK